MIGKPAVASWGANRLDIVIQNQWNGGYSHKVWNGQWWPSKLDWEDHLGVFISPPVVTSWGPNELDIFGQGRDGGYYRHHWDGSNWSGWEGHPGPFIGPPAVFSWGPNRIDVYGQWTSGTYIHQAYNAITGWDPGPGTSVWEQHGGNFISGPAVGSWGVNTVAAFGTDVSGVLELQNWQGFWSPSKNTWAGLGGSVH